MLESLHFSYRGKSSKDFGVIIGSPDGGMYKEPFLPSRKIVEKTVPERNAPYHVRVDDSPMSFPLTIVFTKREKLNNMRDIAMWLYSDEYEPLYFESNPHVILYAIFDGNSQQVHNGLKQGYLTLNVRCNSSYGFSPKIIQSYRINGSFNKEFHNEGDKMIRPNLIITKHGRGDVVISNNATGEELLITDMWDGEIATLDCANEQILSNYEKQSQRYLFKNHNDVWMDWEARTVIPLTFTGNFTVEFIYEFVYLTEYDIIEP